MTSGSAAEAARGTEPAGKIALVANPVAGKGRARALADRVTARLAAAGAEVTALAGGSPEESLDLCRQAVADGAGTLAVLGGDGMVHLALQAVAGTGTALAVLPAGTGNDIARNLGLPHGGVDALDTATDLVLHGVPTPVDAARTTTADGAERWWIGVMCAGFDSAVNERANRMRFPKGPFRYDLAGYVELIRLHPYPFTVTLDGERSELPALMIQLGNGRAFGGGMIVCPGADLHDGMLDLTIWEPVGRLALVRQQPRIYKGTHVDHGRVQVRRAREVTLDSPGVTTYADGERLGPLPASVTCVPGAVRVLLPR
jgi:diacylglycerol kinase (ATP)